MRLPLCHHLHRLQDFLRSCGRVLLSPGGMQTCDYRHATRKARRFLEPSMAVRCTPMSMRCAMWRPWIRHKKRLSDCQVIRSAEMLFWCWRVRKSLLSRGATNTMLLVGTTQRLCASTQRRPPRQKTKMRPGLRGGKLGFQARAAAMARHTDPPRLGRYCLAHTGTPRLRRPRNDSPPGRKPT